MLKYISQLVRYRYGKYFDLPNTTKRLYKFVGSLITMEDEHIYHTHTSENIKILHPMSYYKLQLINEITATIRDDMMI